MIKRATRTTPKFERLTLRATPKDTGNLADTAKALGAFVSTSDTIRVAFAVAAHLARSGALPGVLQAAKASKV